MENEKTVDEMLEDIRNGAAERRRSKTLELMTNEELIQRYQDNEKACKVWRSHGISNLSFLYRSSLDKNEKENELIAEMLDGGGKIIQN